MSDWKKLNTLPELELRDLRRFLMADPFLAFTGVMNATSNAELVGYYLDKWTASNSEIFTLTDTSGRLTAVAIVEALAWDTEMLRTPAARIHYANSLSKDVSVERGELLTKLMLCVKNRLVEQKYRLVDARISTRDLFATRYFEHVGFHTVDVLVTLGGDKAKLERILDQHAPYLSVAADGHMDLGNAVTIRPLQAGDEDIMAKLSRDAFGEVAMIQDRFFLEPTLSHDAASTLFETWFRNCVLKHKSGAGSVLVAEFGGVPMGYVAIDASTHPALGGYWIDSLNAVRSESRGKGVYRGLILGTIAHVLHQGGGGLITKTQVSTQRVVNTWLHLGANLYESFCTLHWTS
jgi:hypothetical protein